MSQANIQMEKVRKLQKLTNENTHKSQLRIHIETEIEHLKQENNHFSNKIQEH